MCVVQLWMVTEFVVGPVSVPSAPVADGLGSCLAERRANRGPLVIHRTANSEVLIQLLGC